MRKIIALGLMAMAAFAAVPAHAAECSGPVSLQCTYVDDNGREVYCDVYVDIDGPDGGSVGGCLELDD